MNLASLFEDAGGRAHLVAMRSLASSSTSRITAITVNRPDLLEMGQLDDLESLLGPVSLNMAATDLSADLLAGHKDFRSMVTLLERMGVQGTSHLRLLRNGTRKLTTLVPDSVNAFGQGVFSQVSCYENHREKKATLFLFRLSNRLLT
jgi:hypothetical protein